MTKTYVWIAFVIFFITLSFYHFRKTKQKIGLFKNKGGVKAINGLSTGVNEFIEDFNIFLDNLNKENKQLNYIACIGYFLASLTAVVSLILS